MIKSCRLHLIRGICSQHLEFFLIFFFYCSGIREDYPAVTLSSYLYATLTSQSHTFIRTAVIRSSMLFTIPVGAHRWVWLVLCFHIWVKLVQVWWEHLMTGQTWSSKLLYCAHLWFKILHLSNNNEHVTEHSQNDRSFPSNHCADLQTAASMANLSSSIPTCWLSILTVLPCRLNSIRRQRYCWSPAQCHDICCWVSF